MKVENIILVDDKSFKKTQTYKQFDKIKNLLIDSCKEKNKGEVSLTHVFVDNDWKEYSIVLNGIVIFKNFLISKSFNFKGVEYIFNFIKIEQDESYLISPTLSKININNLSLGLRYFSQKDFCLKEKMQLENEKSYVLLNEVIVNDRVDERDIEDFIFNLERNVFIVNGVTLTSDEYHTLQEILGDLKKMLKEPIENKKRQLKEMVKRFVEVL